mmetsp:Transcript_20359/g.30210  ORF Transcript_20359/g.30210 Transcript_20359/m.30210 type:complete len:137 (+) Transcript_20359:213-623(+)
MRLQRRSRQWNEEKGRRAEGGWWWRGAAVMCVWIAGRKRIVAGATTGIDRKAGSKGGLLDAFQGRGGPWQAKTPPRRGDSLECFCGGVKYGAADELWIDEVALCSCCCCCVLKVGLTVVAREYACITSMCSISCMS